MMRPTNRFSPEGWLRDVFASRAVQQGQVIRRQKGDIEHYVGMPLFLREIRERGFQAVENRDQVVIFCNQAPIRRLT
ncbi:aspartate aminotransferase [Nioella sp.]|uniref:aspartate aminotransferase n=1 Tax=Nioella sp. TaxID=1912091 RepID=UPI00351469F1